MDKKKKSKKHKNHDIEVWTEEQYEEYLKQLYDMEYIAGFTEGGVPYGLFNEEAETYLIEQFEDSNDSEGEKE